MIKKLNDNFELDRVGEETFACAFYLPETESKHLGAHQFAVKHPEIAGIDILRMNVPNIKSLSVNTVPLSKKFIKKVKEIKQFYKPSSVFSTWNEENKDSLEKIFQMDLSYMKIMKVV